MVNKKLRFECGKCDERFISWQQRDRHEGEGHKPPEVKTETASMQEDSRTLLGGSEVEIGDVIEITKKVVVTKTTKTEGSKDISAVVALIKSSWRFYEK